MPWRDGNRVDSMSGMFGCEVLGVAKWGLVGVSSIAVNLPVGLYLLVTAIDARMSVCW